MIHRWAARAGLVLLAANAYAQSAAEIDRWVRDLADPSKRAVAAARLLDTGAASTGPLGRYLDDGWPDGEQAEAAETAAAQILLELGPAAAGAFADIEHRYARAPTAPLGHLLGQLATYVFPIRVSAPLGPSSLRDLDDHAEWAHTATPRDFAERVSSTKRTHRFAIHHVAANAIAVLESPRSVRDEVEAALLRWVNVGWDDRLLNHQLWPGFATGIWAPAVALARIGSTTPAAALGHTADLASVAPLRRVRALQGLMWFDRFPGWVLAAVIARLDDPDARVAREAVATLAVAVRHEPGCVGALWRASRHANARVRRRAQAVLDRLRRTGRLPKLAEWWWPNGETRSNGPLQGGVAHGEWQYFWANGNPRSRGEYRKGREHGPWTLWHANRTLRAAGSYVRGGRVGDWAFRYDDGAPQSEGRYAGGRPTGVWQWWHRNGALACSGELVDGQRHGAWTFRHANGKLLAESVVYDHGRRVRQSPFFGRNGRPLRAGADVAAMLGESK